MRISDMNNIDSVAFPVLQIRHFVVKRCQGQTVMTDYIQLPNNERVPFHHGVDIRNLRMSRYEIQKQYNKQNRPNPIFYLC